MQFPVELYRKYRPRNLSEVVGQDSAIKTVAKFLEQKKFPAVVLFSGPSGCGKTTIARILARELGCVDKQGNLSKWDFKEINAADERGIGMVREIGELMDMKPMGGGKIRIWLIDECHRLTKDAQSSFLKPLEDTPRNVHFFLATTDPDKLLSTIRTRCTEIKLNPLSDSDVKKLVYSVAEKEIKGFSGIVIRRIVECSAGSARMALVLLHKTMGLKTEEEQLAAVSAADSKGKAFDIVKALLYEKPDWKTVVKAIQEAGDEDHERLRHFVLACARTELLKGNPRTSGRAFLILDVFKSAWYDCSESGLVASCCEVVSNSK